MLFSISLLIDKKRLGFVSEAVVDSQGTGGVMIEHNLLLRRWSAQKRKHYHILSGAMEGSKSEVLV